MKDGLHGGELEWVVARRHRVSIDRLTSFANTVSPVIPRAVYDLRHRFRRLYLYSPRDPVDVRETIAAHYRIAPDEVLIGAGSTELIHLFFQTISGNHVVIPVPTYSEYVTAARKWGCPMSLVPLTADFDLDLTAIRRALTPRTRAIIVCNPNNPTGRLYSRRTMNALVEIADRANATVFVDEAYLCFVRTSSAFSMSRAARHHNVVVVDSLSKLSGAPSLRLGWMVAQPRRLKKFAERKVPGTVGNLALWMTPGLLSDRSHQRKVRDLIARERHFLEGHLREIRGLTVFPSDCNFILLRLDRAGLDADELFERLARKRLVIRAAGNIPGLDRHYFRITVRQHSDNVKLLRALRVLLS